MMEEEGMVIVGLLVGLNVLDANLCLKGEDLDSQVKWGLGSRWNDFSSPETLPRIYRQCQSPDKGEQGKQLGKGEERGWTEAHREWHILGQEAVGGQNIGSFVREVR